jgi:hypothetical protein
VETHTQRVIAISVSRWVAVALLYTRAGQSLLPYVLIALSWHSAPAVCSLFTSPRPLEAREINRILMPTAAEWTDSLSRSVVGKRQSQGRSIACAQMCRQNSPVWSFSSVCAPARLHYAPTVTQIECLPSGILMTIAQYSLQGMRLRIIFILWTAFFAKIEAQLFAHSARVNGYKMNCKRIRKHACDFKQQIPFFFL